MRLWSLPSGEPLRVLRPAIGSGQKGELLAVAPDGHFVVTGAWTGLSLQNVWRTAPEKSATVGHSWVIFGDQPAGCC